MIYLNLSIDSWMCGLMSNGWIKAGKVGFKRDKRLEKTIRLVLRRE